MATRLATLIVCQSGLGGDGLLRWTTQPAAGQEDTIDDVIGEAYRTIRTSLQASRPLLDRITAALEEKQELSGNELRRLAESVGPHRRANRVGIRNPAGIAHLPCFRANFRF